MKLVSGDGHLVWADCDTAPTGDVELILVYTTDLVVNHGGVVCFEALRSVGRLTMEVPAVYEIRGDGQRPGTGHDITATIKPEGAPERTITVDSDGSTQVGAGTSPPGPPTVLLELRVTG